MKTRFHSLPAIATISSALVLATQAQVLTKANNATTLNLAGSWVENTAPGSSNILRFNSTWTPANIAMGGSLNVSGIQVTNVATGNGRISGTSGQTLTLGSDGIDMSTASGNFRIDPAIILSANQTWSVASGRILNLAANGISGDFTAQVNGAGTLAFDASGTATYGSQLEVNASTLRINFATTDVTLTNPNNSFTSLTLFNGTGRFNSIANAGLNSAAGAFTTAGLGGNNTSGLFVYTGDTAITDRNFQVDRRSAASGILVTNAGQTLTIGGTITHNTGNDSGVQHNAFRVGGAGNLTLSGAIADNVNASFETRLEKEGGGTLTLTNSNTFAGGVNVATGSLVVNNTSGSATGSGPVNVSTGAALGGAGIIAGITTISGSLAPGNSIGTLTVANDLTWNGGNDWIFELGLPAIDLAAAAISSDGDLLSLTGPGSDFLKGTGSSWTFDFANSGAAGWYKLVDWTGTTGFSADDFTATNLAGGLSASFIVDSGTSALYLNLIPEPSAALLGGIGLLGLLRRRRQAAA